MATDDLKNGIIMPHRDDIPMEVAEGIVKHLQELMPGYKVVFAGDAPIDQQLEMAPQFQNFTDAVNKAFVDGGCFYCGKKLPGWPDSLEDDAAWEAWQPPIDWNRIPLGPDDDSPMIFECPDCAKTNSDEGAPTKVNSPYLINQNESDDE